MRDNANAILLFIFVINVALIVVVYANFLLVMRESIKHNTEISKA